MASSAHFFPTLSLGDALASVQTKSKAICPLIRTGKSPSSALAASAHAQNSKAEAPPKRARKKPAKSSGSEVIPPNPSSLATAPGPPSAADKAKSFCNDEARPLLCEDTSDFVFEHSYTMSEVCDRLFEVLTVEKTTEEEWRKLLILSGEWSRIRPYFFKRLDYRAKSESNPLTKQSFVTLSEKLKVVCTFVTSQTNA
jgi:hypothetical protein